jgi:hypothetical protein
MAVNNAALAAITPLLVATTKPKAVVKKKIAVEQTVAVAEPRKQSQRLAAKPKRSYAEADLFPALPFEYIAIKKAKSKNDSNTARDKNKKGKKDGSDDNKKAKDKDQAINSNGDIKARPAYKDRPEWGLNRVTISEVDLAIIRDDYAAIRLPGFMVDGKHPKDFSTVKKTCRITNREFDKLNLLKEARKEKLLKKSKANDNEWVAASIIASERFEKAMADRVEAAKDKKASK